MLTTIPVASSGPWSIVRIEVDETGDAMPGCGLDKAPPGTYTALVHETRGIISCDSPMLMDDQRPVVDDAVGHIVLGGLGVGVCIDMLLESGGVEHITVVEIDQHVIDLVSPSFEYGEHGDMITFANCDILGLNASNFELQPDRVWLDIWDTDRPETLVDRLKATTDWGKSCAWVRAAALPRVYEKAARAMRGN